MSKSLTALNVDGPSLKHMQVPPPLSHPDTDGNELEMGTGRPHAGPIVGEGDGMGRSEQPERDIESGMADTDAGYLGSAADVENTQAQLKLKVKATVNKGPRGSVKTAAGASTPNKPNYPGSPITPYASTASFVLGIQTGKAELKHHMSSSDTDDAEGTAGAGMTGKYAMETGKYAIEHGQEKHLLHGFYKYPYQNERVFPRTSFPFVPGSKQMQAKPFVFISSAHLQSEHFDIVKVFQALSAPVDMKFKDLTPQVKVPSIIFRLNSTNDTNTWNVRLPSARMNLAAAQFNIERPNDDLLLHATESPMEEDNQDQDFCDGAIVGHGNNSNNSNKKSQASRPGGIPVGDASSPADGNPVRSPANFLATAKGMHMSTSVLKTGGNGLESKKDQLTAAEREHNILERRRESNTGKGGKDVHVKHLLGSKSAISHYQSVLREKCKRLLKGTYAACEQAGAMFRIDEVWSEEYPNDCVTDWLTDGYKDENIKLIGLGDIKNLHPDLRKEFSVYDEKSPDKDTFKAKPFKADEEKDKYEPNEYFLPKDIVEGFTSVAAIDASIAELKELRAWRLALSVAALQDNDIGVQLQSPLRQQNLQKLLDEVKDFPFSTQKALDDARCKVLCCQKQVADLILKYMQFLFAEKAKQGYLAGIGMPPTFAYSPQNLPDGEKFYNASHISPELGELHEHLCYFCDIFADKSSPADVLIMMKTMTGDKEDPGHVFLEYLDKFFDKDKFDDFSENFDPTLERIDHIVTMYHKVRVYFAMPVGTDVRRRMAFPHRALTHLILTDDIDLLELKFAEIVPWGAIIINGGEATADVSVDCVQRGRPLISVKYTGGTADLVVGMLEKKNFYLKAKKIDPEFDMPVPNEVAYNVRMPEEGWQQEDWLKAFDRPHTRTAFKMNALLENWPDRFSEASVFVVDTFVTTEDDVQDRITQTMAVVFESAHELGGSVSEQKRLTYAWRVRHKFLFNANLYKFISDLLYMMITMLTMLCTMSAVVYSYFQIYPNSLSADMYTKVTLYLGAFNLVLPLVATIVRGIYASVSPLLKYVALKNACVQVEGEIYMYRTKVGKYSVSKKSPTADDKKKDGKGKDGKVKEKDAKAKSGGSGGNPRKAFSSALDNIWGDLSSSDVQNGSLRNPFPLFIGFEESPLTDINKRIMSNREEQDNYLTLLMAKMDKGDEAKKKKKKDVVIPSVEEKQLEEKLEKFKKRSLKRQHHDKHRIEEKILAEEKGAAEFHGVMLDTNDTDEDDKGVFELIFKIKFAALFLPAFYFMNDTELKPLGDLVEKDGVKTRALLNRKQAEKYYKNNRPLSHLLFQNTVARMEQAMRIAIEQYELAKYTAEEAQKRIAEMAVGQKIMLDDGMSALSADQYVRIRLLPMAAFYSASAPALASSVSMSAVISVILSVASSALSTFNLSVVIPALLAISGAITAWINYQQIDLRLMQTNAAINRLNQVPHLCSPRRSKNPLQFD